ncbi:transposase [Lewinella sp. IMCC34191]|uniref:transposase n=1 Tax=Lewinella sp. IMCC34191 TaxID=2259172 RepID=UPI000E247141|nr:transposase [Lewinella sp. IMCC34191]
MNAYFSTVYQIVFATKYRQPTLTKPGREELFKCICGILKNKKCFPYRVGGVEDHLHIVCSVHPSVAVSDLVKDVKLGATSHIKEAGLFPKFDRWQRGYAAFTYAPEALPNLINYVMNQENHHRRKSSLQEVVDLLEENGVEYDSRYVD